MGTPKTPFSQVPHWLYAMVAEGLLPSQVIVTYGGLGLYVSWSATDRVAWPSQADPRP